MNKSESIAALAAALAKAQGKIGAAVKDSANPFFKSKYADLASVTDAIKGPLAANGLSYVQISHPHDGAVCIETIIMHESGEWIGTGIVHAPVAKHDPQGFGSAQTYARRYSLQMAFGVPAEDDDGNAAVKAPPPKQAKQQQSIEDSAYLTFEKQWKEDMDNAALAGPKTLQASFDSMPVGPHKQEFWKRHGAALKAAAQKAIAQAEAA